MKVPFALLRPLGAESLVEAPDWTVREEGPMADPHRSDHG